MSPVEIILIALTAINLIALILLLTRRSGREAESYVSRTENIVRQELTRTETAMRTDTASLRQELTRTVHEFGQVINQQMTALTQMQQGQFESFGTRMNQQSQSNEARLEQMRTTVETRIKALQEDNSTKLEAMRATVDEKLNATLEKRLNESFSRVSQQLEQVYKGLGEMQSLASGVGDLKKVLSNVKTRGTWGEVSLGMLLEQILTSEQFGQNVAIPAGGRERVEFAVRYPGHEEGREVWLPIDAKFPQEQYLRIVEASESGDAAAVAEELKRLKDAIIKNAKDISEKYIKPPYTTDMAIMYLPTEGLFAEVLRITGLTESMQRDYRVMVAGPTTIAALLHSLQVGFRSIAIEKRATEVITLLTAFRTEFARFGDVVTKTQKKLQEASNTMEDMARRTRVIQRKLSNVEQLGGEQVLIEATEDADVEDAG